MRQLFQYFLPSDAHTTGTTSSYTEMRTFFHVNLRIFLVKQLEQLRVNVWEKGKKSLSEKN